MGMDKGEREGMRGWGGEGKKKKKSRGVRLYCPCI